MKKLLEREVIMKMKKLLLATLLIPLMFFSVQNVYSFEKQYVDALVPVIQGIKKNTPEITILDVGAGTLQITNMLRKFFPEGVYAVDPLGASTGEFLKAGTPGLSFGFNYPKDQFHYAGTVEALAKGENIPKGFPKKFDVLLVIRPVVNTDRSSYVEALRNLIKDDGSLLTIEDGYFEGIPFLERFDMKTQGCQFISYGLTVYKPKPMEPGASVEAEPSLAGATAADDDDDGIEDPDA